MDTIGRQMDEAMGKMRMAKFSPKLNEPRDPAEWLAAPGSPKPERPESIPQTIDYDELIKQWTQ
jgi:glycerol transport system substrate-binding protein